MHIVCFSFVCLYVCLLLLVLFVITVRDRPNFGYGYGFGAETVENEFRLRFQPWEFRPSYEHGRNWGLISASGRMCIMTFRVRDILTCESLRSGNVTLLEAKMTPSRPQVDLTPSWPQVDLIKFKGLDLTSHRPVTQVDFKRLCSLHLYRAGQLYTDRRTNLHGHWQAAVPRLQHSAIWL